ncbi:hypothetical protein HOF46_01560 [Candidatus Woesearchaeota archaeon]|nr:hypothetical protein [Candidatus Woesearchaeota archaeon]MBT4114479.1 hypothetical protein [Candidatus Woesearchaeota archaeon]
MAWHGSGCSGSGSNRTVEYTFTLPDDEPDIASFIDPIRDTALNVYDLANISIRFSGKPLEIRQVHLSIDHTNAIDQSTLERELKEGQLPRVGCSIAVRGVSHPDLYFPGESEIFYLVKAPNVPELTLEAVDALLDIGKGENGEAGDSIREVLSAQAAIDLGTNQVRITFGTFNWDNPIDGSMDGYLDDFLEFSDLKSKLPDYWGALDGSTWTRHENPAATPKQVFPPTE